MRIFLFKPKEANHNFTSAINMTENDIGCLELSCATVIKSLTEAAADDLYKGADSNNKTTIRYGIC